MLVATYGKLDKFVSNKKHLTDRFGYLWSGGVGEWGSDELLLDDEFVS